MVGRVASPRETVTSGRDDSATTFTPAEAVAVLRLDGIDYRQLTHLLELARQQAGLPNPTSKSWARWTYLDLVTVDAIAEICVDREALKTAEVPVAVRTVKIKRACLRLRDQGFINPVLQVNLQVQAGRVVATLHGLTFDVMSGQAHLISDADRRPVLPRLVTDDRALQARLDAGLADAVATDVGGTDRSGTPTGT